MLRARLAITLRHTVEIPLWVPQFVTLANALWPSYLRAKYWNAIVVWATLLTLSCTSSPCHFV